VDDVPGNVPLTADVVPGNVPPAEVPSVTNPPANSEAPPLPLPIRKTARSPYPYLPLELRSLPSPVDSGEIAKVVGDAVSAAVTKAMSSFVDRIGVAGSPHPEYQQNDDISLDDNTSPYDSEDILLGDAEKVAKAWKSSTQFPKIKLFLGDTDDRSIRQFYSLITTSQAYRFSNTAERYFYVYRLLDGKPARLVDKHMKHFRDARSFDDLLRELWKVLYDEYSSSGDYFQVRRRLMALRMSLGGTNSVISRYEDYCDEFMNLSEQLLDDDDLGENAYRKE
ncbi:hypothetical protein FOZ62_006045, partial [Perkinsus olseni]